MRKETFPWMLEIMFFLNSFCFLNMGVGLLCLASQSQAGKNGSQNTYPK